MRLATAVTSAVESESHSGPACAASSTGSRPLLLALLALPPCCCECGTGDVYQTVSDDGPVDCRHGSIIPMFSGGGFLPRRIRATGFKGDGCALLNQIHLPLIHMHFQRPEQIGQ